MTFEVQTIRRVLVAQLHLSSSVSRIEFNRSAEIQLDCHICRRTGRTVVMNVDEKLSYCLKTHHPYPGRVTGVSVSVEQRSGGVLVRGVYAIEYKFAKF